jgi:hypothetical protein
VCSHANANPCGPLHAIQGRASDSFIWRSTSLTSSSAPNPCPRLAARKMGNQNSRSNPQSPTNKAAGSSSSSSNTNTSHANVTASHGHERPQHHHHLPHLHPPHSQHHSARRRESIQALSAAKAPAAPSVSLENAESHPTSARPISRGRAQTLGTSTQAITSQLRTAQDHYNNARTHSTHDNMGNEQSSQKAAQSSARGDKDKPRDTARDATPPSSQPTPMSDIAQPQSAGSAPEAGAEASPSPRAPSPTLPVDVPSTLTSNPLATDIPSSLDPISASADYLPPASQFSRPPRLPLPIEEEVHTPGSPIISPQEIWTPVHESDADGMLPRRSSMLSTTTADDEDLGEEFKTPGQGRPTVPTLIEWEGPGERVYVTGTFAGWNRKYKLHRK